MAANPVGQDTDQPTEKSTQRHHFPWVRLWVELSSDPKLRTIARASGQPVGNVLAVLIALITDAANAPDRGYPTIETEDLASLLDYEHVQVAAILEAMQGRVLEGGKLAGWDRRQPKREDGSAERARDWRTERNRTQPNARGEKRRGD